MEKFYIFLLLALIPLSVRSQENRIDAGGGVEFLTQGQGSETNEVWGYRPIAGSHMSLTKVVEGKEIFRTKISIGTNGFRKSSASGAAGKEKHLFLIDGSYVFGDGLSDDETLAHELNKQSKIFEVYPIAFSGHGPQHAWLHFAEKQLPQKIMQKAGSAIIFTHENDIARLFGGINVLSYAAVAPILKELSPGVFKVEGRFDSAGNFWQKALWRYCVPRDFCKSWMTSWHSVPTDEEYAYAARVFADIEKMYREQFQVEKISYVWTGNREEFLRFSRITGITPVHFDLPISRIDSHPSHEGTKSIAKSIFDRILTQ